MKNRWLCVLLLVLASDILADERPRIGLVLGGGGARGAAHIGVLQELERHRVPIDAIAGTSMGAIVGGLYASGMTPDELADLVSSLDWAEKMSDEAQRENLSFRRKQDDAQYPINHELGLRDGELLLPMGVIQGQKLDLLLRELTAHVAHIEAFDDLPTPFRAIASDVVSGDALVMDRGDLAIAIRASMSVPGVFAPARVGDRLLVDGGLVGNLPIDVMRTMDVDIIIAVDVEFPLYPADELDSVLAVSEQMLTILIRRDTLRQIESLAASDILIRPELGLFASTDFGNIVDAIPPGVAAAQAVSDRLAALALDAGAYAEHIASRARAPQTPDTLAFVRVVHDDRVDPGLREPRLRSREGDVIDTRRLERDAERLYGLGRYEQVSYRLVQEDGRTGVEFLARSKSLGPDTLKFSVSLEDDFEGSTGFNVATRLTKTGLNPSGGEWRTDLRLGSDPLLATELYQPFGRQSRFFVAPHVDMRQSGFNVFEGDAAIGRLRLSEGVAGLDFGMEIGDWGEARVGAFRGKGRANVKIGDSAIPDLSFNTGGTFARLRVDSLDHAHFPSSGIRADLRWVRSLTGFGADHNVDTFESELQGTWSLGRNRMQLGLAYATTLNGAAQVQDYFPLGGFLRMSGLERGAISGPHAGLARLVYYRRVGSPAGGMLDVPFYLGASVEAGNVWQTRSEIGFDSMQMSGSLFAGLDTYIGPIFLAAGFAEGGDTHFYLFVGSPPR